MKHPLPLITAEKSISVPPMNRLAPGAARWRWMALSGVAAGTAAVTPGAFAEVVQILQLENYIDSTSTSSFLRPELTGELPLELPGLTGVFGAEGVTIFTDKPNNRWTRVYKANAKFTPVANGPAQSLGEARYFTSGVGLQPGVGTSSRGFVNWINNVKVVNQQDRSGLIPLTFTDSRINKGAPTDAWLEVRTQSSSKTIHRVSLVRLVFDDASTTRPSTGGPNPVTPGGSNTNFDPNKPDIINIINNGSTVNKAAMEIDLAILKQRLKKYKVRYKKASKRNKTSPRYKLLGRNVKRLQIDIKRLQDQIRNS